MNEVSEICDRVIVLNKGKIIANDTPKILAESISNVLINLKIYENLDFAINYLISIKKKFNKDDSGQLIIEINENEIAEFLIKLSEQKIFYSNISIDKPTLENYFLNISKENII